MRTRMSSEDAPSLVIHGFSGSWRRGSSWTCSRKINSRQNNAVSMAKRDLVRLSRWKHLPWSELCSKLARFVEWKSTDSRKTLA